MALPNPLTLASTSAQQYRRSCKLIVASANGSGLDLSELRIKFSIKRSDTQTPNTADIRVYNLSEETAVQIRKEFTKVVLEAGYEGNRGVIFKGNIKQVILGRESATDTFIDIVAGDGDKAYNFAIVNTTLAKGSTQANQIQAAVASMQSKGVTQGPLGKQTTTVLPRGKAMFGPAKNYLRNSAQTTGNVWSIQDEKVTLVSTTSYLPGTAIVLNSNTGMIGTPQQTNDGVNIKCLLNPGLNVSTRVQIDESSIARIKTNLEAIAASNAAGLAAPILPHLSIDGIYYILTLEHSGDTRGVDWYSSLICLNVSAAANPRNSVSG